MIEDRSQNFYIYLDALAHMKETVKNGRPKKQLHADKLGHNTVLAYDEAKRMLVISGSDVHKVSKFLHLFHAYQLCC